MKFFEKEIVEHASGNNAKKTENDRKFSYLQDHEVAKLKNENDRKMSNMSEDDIKTYVEERAGPQVDYAQRLEKSTKAQVAPVVQPDIVEQDFQERIKRDAASSPVRRPGPPPPPPRSATLTKQEVTSAPNGIPALPPKTHQPVVASKRTCSLPRMYNNNNSKSLNEDELALELEKKEKWRKARLRSLEEDALRAQMANKSRRARHHAGGGETSLSRDPSRDPQQENREPNVMTCSMSAIEGQTGSRVVAELQASPAKLTNQTTISPAHAQRVSPTMRRVQQPITMHAQHHVIETKPLNGKHVTVPTNCYSPSHDVRHKPQHDVTSHYSKNGMNSDLNGFDIAW